MKIYISDSDIHKTSLLNDRTKKIVQVLDNMINVIFVLTIPLRVWLPLIRCVPEAVSGAGQPKVQKGNKSVRMDNKAPRNTSKQIILQTLMFSLNS